MKAVVYDAARSYAVKEIPTPQAGPGDVRIKVPRDRTGSFDPVVVPKHARRLTGFDDVAVVAGHECAHVART